MSRATSLAIVFYVGAAFAGAAVGVAVDRSYIRAPQRLDARAARTWTFNQLKLSAAQRDSATAIYDARDGKLKALMDSNKALLAPLRARQDSLFEEGRQRISRLLTPEQKTIYDQMRREREAQRPERKQ